ANGGAGGPSLLSQEPCGRCDHGPKKYDARCNDVRGFEDAPQAQPAACACGEVLELHAAARLPPAPRHSAP
ncbi:unnamed protein product, partial [Amoebophrya sp. A25]